MGEANKKSHDIEMRVINTLGEKNKLTIRKYFKSEYGLKDFLALSNFTLSNGIDIGKRKATQEKRTYEFLADIYNDSIITERKIKKQTKQAEKKKKLGRYVNVTINVDGYRLATEKEGQTGTGDLYVDNKVKDLVAPNVYKDIYFSKKYDKPSINLDNKIHQKGKGILKRVSYKGFLFIKIQNKELIFHSRQPILDVSKWIEDKRNVAINGMIIQSPIDYATASITKQTILNTKPAKDPKALLIKQAGTLNLDHHKLKNSEWDKGRDMCVVDFIQYKYMNRKGFIKPLKANDKYSQKEKDDAVQFYSTHFLKMGKCFKDEDAWEEEASLTTEPNVNGYTIYHIEQFCENLGVNMICLIDNQIKYHYTTKNAKKNPCFCFVMKNNHLYPVVDTHIIKRFTDEIRNVKSHIQQKSAKKEDDDGKSQMENVFKPKDKNELTKLQYAIDVMEQQNTQTNYPTNLKISNDIVCNFQVEGKRYLHINEDDILNEEIMRYCKDKDIKYFGQSSQAFTYDYIKEFSEIYNSYLNEEVREALVDPAVKNRTHIGAVVPLEEIEEVYDEAECYDINKAYRNAMVNPLESFMTIDFTTEIEEVDNSFIADNVPFGMYYVDTYDFDLMFGANFYSSAMIKEAKKLNIEFEIVYFIKGDAIDGNPIKKIIDKIVTEMTGYPTLMKEVINSIYGMFAKTKNKSCELNVDTDINRVWENYALDKGKYNNKLMVDKITSSSGKDYYLYGDKHENAIFNINLPIAIQIQDFSNIYFKRMIDKLGGKLLWRKTDCCLIHHE